MSIKTYPRDIGGYQYIEFDSVLDSNKKIKKGNTKMAQQNSISENTDNDQKGMDLTKQLVLVNETHYISNIRDKMYLHKKTLEKIELRDIIVKQRLCLFKLLDMEEIIRSEVMLQLFKQEDLTIADFPKLKEIIIDLKPTKHERKEIIQKKPLNTQNQADNSTIINIKQDSKEEEKKNNQSSKKNLKNVGQDEDEEEEPDYVNDSKALMNRNYLDLVKDVQDTLMSHKKLKQYMNEKKVTLINYVFNTMETFNYAYKFLDNYYETIECLIFRNIKRLQKDTFIKLGQVISKQKVLNQLIFEYVFLSNYHVEVIRDILGRRRDKWVSLSFIQCGLNWMDLRTLFIDNLRIKDLSNLVFLNIVKNPLLQNSSILQQIQDEMEHRRSKLKKQVQPSNSQEQSGCVIENPSSTVTKVNTAINALVKTGFSRALNSKEQQEQQIFQDMEPKSLIFDNLFNAQNDIGLQNILISYTKCDCCQMLSLKNFNISETSSTIQDLLIQVICDTKSLIYVNLENTSFPTNLINKLALKLQKNKKILAYLNLSNLSINNWLTFFSFAWPFVSTLILDNCQLIQDNLQGKPNSNIKVQQQQNKENLFVQQIIQGIKTSNQINSEYTPIKLEIFSLSIQNSKNNVDLQILNNLINIINQSTSLDLLRLGDDIISLENLKTLQNNINKYYTMHQKTKKVLSNNYLNLGIKEIIISQKNNLNFEQNINQLQQVKPIYKSLFPNFLLENTTIGNTKQPQQEIQQNEISQDQNYAQIYYGVKYELRDNVSLKEQWEFTKPKIYFQINGVAFKALSIGKDRQSNQPTIRSEKFGLDLLYGLRTGMKNWTSDTITHVLNYLDISDCSLFSSQLITDLSCQLILDQTQLQSQEEIIMEFQDLEEELLQSFTKVQNLYMDSFKLQEKGTNFINLCEIFISASGERCKPKTLQYLLEAAIFAAGNNLRQITIGSIEDKYCQPLCDGLISGKEQLKKYYKVNYDPEELSLQNIETFPEQLVKNFLTNCGSTPKVLKIKGLGIFQNVRQVFEEFEQKNMKKQVQLESFIFRYSSCFGIGPDEQKKLVQTVLGPNVKFIDIRDDDQEDTTATINQYDQTQIAQQQPTKYQTDKLALEDDEDDCRKLIFSINKEYKHEIVKKIKEKYAVQVKKYQLDENAQYSLQEQLKRFRKIFKEFKKLKNNINNKDPNATKQVLAASAAAQNQGMQIQISKDINKSTLLNIALSIDCEKFTFPLEIAHAMHSKFEKNDFTSKEIQEKLAPIFENGPEELYIDFYFLENFLLGTLGIYPSKDHIYSYIMKQSFFEYLDRNWFTLKARFIQFLPTTIDSNMEMLGEGAKDDILDIYNMTRNSEIDQLIFNYSWNSEEPFSDIKLRTDPKTNQEIWEPRSEKELIDMFIRMPPSKFRIKNCSINALKLIYVICYRNPNFQDCEIVYDSVNVVNAGIAYALRDYFRTPEISSNQCACFDCGISIKYYLRKIMCSIFDAIVEDDVNYKYDESVIALDGFLEKNRLSYYLILFLTIAYYAICCFCPYYFSERDGLISKDKIGRGVSWTSHIIYGIFALVTFLIEMYLYIHTLKRIFHLAPPLKMSVGQGFIPRTINKFKTLVINFRWFSYQYVIFGKALLLSQNQRLDFYSDVSFIIVCLQNDFQDLAFISAAILVFTLIHSIYKMMSSFFFKLCCDRNKTKISTHYINEFYEAAVNIEFVALGNVLDIMAPYNVTQIPNNCISRLFIPNQTGLSINARMIETSFRIFFEDVPQIIMQILFMLRTSKGDMTIFISFGSSILSIIAQLVTFLTLRPSIITQMDFQKLSKRKLDQLPKIRKNFLKDSKKMWDQIYSAFKKQEQSALSSNPNAQQKSENKDNENEEENIN